MQHINLTLDEKEVGIWRSGNPQQTLSSWVRVMIYKDNHRTEDLSSRLEKLKRNFISMQDNIEERMVELEKWTVGINEGFGKNWTSSQLRAMLEAYPLPANPTPER